MQKHFEDYGNEVFQLFFRALHESNTQFWLACGTLLGAVRENGFIKGDCDMDIGVYDDTDFDLLDSALKKNGFELKRRIDIYSKNGFKGFELTYFQKEVGVDIFVFHREDEKHLYMCDFADTITIGKYKLHQFVRKIVVPFDGLIDYEFMGFKVFIPKNYKEYIAAHYGEDFMTPNPSWGVWDSPALQIVEGAIGMEIV
jgi:phosphorylcholine metabolism protein LicD